MNNHEIYVMITEKGNYLATDGRQVAYFTPDGYFVRGADAKEWNWAAREWDVPIERAKAQLAADIRSGFQAVKDRLENRRPLAEGEMEIEVSDKLEIINDLSDIYQKGGLYYGDWDAFAKWISEITEKFRGVSELPNLRWWKAYNGHRTVTEFLEANMQEIANGKFRGKVAAAEGLQNIPTATAWDELSIDDISLLTDGQLIIMMTLTKSWQGSKTKRIWTSQQTEIFVLTLSPSIQHGAEGKNELIIKDWLKIKQEVARFDNLTEMNHLWANFELWKWDGEVILMRKHGDEQFADENQDEEIILEK